MCACAQAWNGAPLQDGQGPSPTQKGGQGGLSWRSPRPATQPHCWSIRTAGLSRLGPVSFPSQPQCSHPISLSLSIFSASSGFRPSEGEERRCRERTAGQTSGGPQTCRLPAPLATLRPPSPDPWEQSSGLPGTLSFQEGLDRPSGPRTPFLADQASQSASRVLGEWTAVYSLMWERGVQGRQAPGEEHTGWGGWGLAVWRPCCMLAL